MTSRSNVVSRIGAAFLVASAAAAAIGFRSTGNASEMPLGKVVVETASGRHPFTVERAETPAHQSRGLMHRRHMKADHGMLFTWPSERRIEMWMANTVLSLDMVFIKKSGEVHRIEENTIPFSRELISSGVPVLRVLELNAGTAEKIALEPGDRVYLQ